MSKEDIAQRMEALRKSGAGTIIALHLRDRLERKTEGLLACTPTTFEAQKGRCLELKELIAYFEG